MPGKYRFPEELPVPSAGGAGEPHEPDSPLVVQLALSRATDLARRGKYEEAERMLADLRLSPRQAVAVLHLCARMRAQLGMYEEAADFWKRALQYEPGHEGARAGMRQIQRLRARPLWLAPILSWPVALAVLAGALALVIARPASSPGAIKDVIEEQGKTADQLRRLRTSVDGLQKRLEGASKAPPAFEAGDLPVKTAIHGDEVLVRFTLPLFDRGIAVLRPEAGEAVARFGKRLVPVSGKASIIAFGYAVEPEGDPAALARSRAAHVLEVLRAVPGLEGSTDPLPRDLPLKDIPFPADPPEQQAVVLRLSHVQK